MIVLTIRNTFYVHYYTDAGDFFSPHKNYYRKLTETFYQGTCNVPAPLLCKSPVLHLANFWTKNDFQELTVNVRE